MIYIAMHKDNEDEYSVNKFDTYLEFHYWYYGLSDRYRESESWSFYKAEEIKP